MCGIVANVRRSSSDEQHLVQTTMKSLQMLLNRGYDSVGLGIVSRSAILRERTCDLSMFHENVTRLSAKAETEGATSCIGHTRWATHGRGVMNAHPHVSMRGVFGLVHNGIIENYRVLKESLASDRYSFGSETDSEVVVNLLEQVYMAQQSPSGRSEVEVALQRVLSLLEGTYALAVVCRDTPGDVYLAKDGSPMLVGEGVSCMMASSEVSGFRDRIEYCIAVPPRRVVILSAEDGIIVDGMQLRIRHGLSGHTVYEVRNNVEAETPYPWRHWMLKEVAEQPEMVMRLGHAPLCRVDDLDRHMHTLKEVTAVVLIGCGTSLNACQCARTYFLSLCNIRTASVFDAAAFEVADVPRLPNDERALVCMCSQSGETRDLLRCLEMLRERSTTKTVTLGIVNVAQSQIAREVDCVVFMHAGREISVPSTKSFTASLIMLYLVSTWLRFDASALPRVATQICDLARHMRQLAIQSEEESFSHRIYEKHNLDAINKQSLFVLGYGKMHSVAQECALKFKEVCHIHAEAFHGGALKHGAFALLSSGFPVILLVDHQNRQKMTNTYEELNARCACIFTVTDCADRAQWEGAVRLPRSNFPEVLFTNILHIFAYAVAMQRGVNPDRPRHLAKVVTVS